jgi:spermidine/putrescine transport system ATP-binding protein
MCADADRGRVRVEGAWHRFRDFVALRGVSLDVGPGQFLTLLGPSGSGKTTLLRVVAGLVQPTAGRVFIGARDVTRLPPEKREIGFVFQNYALFPHLTVFENVAFALRLRRRGRDEVQQRVHEALERVYLTGLDARRPAELSGGQQQRVALARAIVFNPALLLMDEPLGSLDKRLREQLQVEIRRLQREVGITTIYVTHDQEEAFSLSDRIAVMQAGEVHQLGVPEEIYRRPADAFVAHFVGDLNYFDGQLIPRPGGRATLRTAGGLVVEVMVDGVAPQGARVGCGIRPEKLQIGRELRTDNCYLARVRTRTFRGSHYWAELVLPSGDRVVALLRDDCTVAEGDEVSVGWNATEARVFAGRKDEA